jgi:ankyrin repeat protein
MAGKRIWEMSLDQDLAAVIEKYERYPQFLGIEITDVNQRAAMNDTMLHFAAELGSTEDIDVLVASGAEVNAIGDICNTPLHGAAMMGKAVAATRLLELGADPTLRNELGQCAVDVADIGGHDKLAEILRAFR